MRRAPDLCFDAFRSRAPASASLEGALAVLLPEDLVSSRRLGAIHLLVRGGDEVFGGQMPSAAGNPGAERDRECLRVPIELDLGEALAKLVEDGARGFRQCIEQENGKFLAAVTRHDVDAAKPYG